MGALAGVETVGLTRPFLTRVFKTVPALREPQITLLRVEIPLHIHANAALLLLLLPVLQGTVVANVLGMICTIRIIPPRGSCSTFRRDMPPGYMFALRSIIIHFWTSTCPYYIPLTRRVRRWPPKFNRTWPWRTVPMLVRPFKYDPNRD